MAAKNMTAYPRLFRYVETYLPRNVSKVEKLLDGVKEAKIEDRLYLTNNEQKLIFVKTNIKERRPEMNEVSDCVRIQLLEARVEHLEKELESIKRLLKKDGESCSEDRDESSDGGGSGAGGG
jgi:capsule polysaccharide export protein KpsE/RkpR